MHKKILFFSIIILFSLIIIVFAQVNEEKREYILLELKYDNGSISLINKSLETGNYPEYNHYLNRSYDLRLLSLKGEIIYENSLNPTLIYSDAFEEFTEGGIVEIKETNFFVVVPSIKEGEKVEILKQGEKIFEEGIYDVGATPCRIK